MIVGFTGLKGSGKDTAAQVLIDERGYTKIAFADKLKDAVAALFKISRDDIEMLKNDLSWVEVRWPLADEAAVAWSFREFLQRFGTEMGREVFGQDFWIEQWKASVLQRGSHSIAVPDVRFRNEASAIRTAGAGCVIGILRPGVEPDGHASEEPLPVQYLDYVIENDGTIEDLHRKVLEVVDGKA